MPTNKPGKDEGSQEGLSNLLRDCLVCGVVIVNGRKKIVTLAGEAKKILGLKARQALPQPLEILPAPLARIVRSTMVSGKSIADLHLELAASGGQPLLIAVSAVPIQPAKKTSGVALVLRDLTGAKRLEQDMQRLDRLATIGTLSASMAHEIKNALVAGKTFIQLLVEKNQDAELAGIVRREMDRIDSIVSQMLKFAGPAKPAFTAIRLHEILEHSLRLVQTQMNGKSITLNRLFQAVPDLAKGDDYQLQQAFVNLFLNALEAMAPKGMLTVATETVPTAAEARASRDFGEASLRVTIKDTGAGIAPENLARLFEPFFTTKPSGTGLGLPITRRIIQEHGGAITVESRPHEGTTFSVMLPALG
jgi:two-component system, NtrC family, sensor histidine kinase HydH